MIRRHKKSLFISTTVCLGIVLYLVQLQRLNWTKTSLITNNNPHTSTPPPSCIPYANYDYPPPQECRQYHRCIYERIPHVTPILETAQYILHTNKSFIRICDADLQLILGQNRSYQTASQDLSNALRAILHSNHSDLALGIPDVFSGFPEINKGGQDFWKNNDWIRQLLLKNTDMTRQYFTCFISAVGHRSYKSHCNLVGLVYRTLREIWHEKDIVYLRGDNKQEYKYDIYDNARSKIEILAPRYQAWNSYEELKKRIFAEDERKLYILTAGVVGKVIAYDLVQSGRRALDLGHLAKDYNEYMSQTPDSNFYVD